MSELPTSELEHRRSIKEVMNKLPDRLRDSFIKFVDAKQQQGTTVTFADIVDLVGTEVRVKNNPVFGVSGIGEVQGRLVLDSIQTTKRLGIGSAQLWWGVNLSACSATGHITLGIAVN